MPASRNARLLTISIVAAASLTLGLLVATPASAATITVNTFIDEYGGSGSCSLRDAAEAANTDAAFGGCPAGTGNDTISIPAGVHQLTVGPGTNENLNVNGDIDLTDSDGVTVQGAGIVATIVDGNGPVLDERVFDVLGGSATFNDLTIRNGREYSAGSGGGIYAGGGGVVTFQRTSIHNNRTYYYGGGIASGNGTDIVVLDSLIANNEATGDDGDGGGINANSLLTVKNTTVADNYAYDYGGGIKAYQGITMENSVVSGNSVTNGEGGGIWVDPRSLLLRTQDAQGEDSILNSTIANNTGAENGGGVWVDNSTGGILDIYSSTISNNAAQNGGGIYNANTSIIDMNGGATYLENVTVSSNYAYFNGGGIYNTGDLTTNHTTIYKNIADDDGGGIYDPTSTTLSYRNTIIAQNLNEDCYAGMSLGHNLLGPGCPDDSSGDDTDLYPDPDEIDPRLGPLLDNGGPTRTHELLSGSPAIDQAEGAPTCPATDQRGLTRPTGAQCDIGAYEVGSLAQVGGEVIVLDLRCRKRDPTIIGTSGNDKITGTPGADVIQGREGTDTIKGLGGNDIICGARGNDTIKAGSGNDILKGHRGVDIYNAGKGKDLCIPGPGDDVYKGCEAPPQTT